MTFDTLTIDQKADLPDIGPVRMPVPLASIIGRESETGDLCSLVSRPEVRLVTITGQGGVGKTRLALKVIENIRAQFATAHYYIQLDTLKHPGHVVPAILQVLRHYHAPGAGTVGELASALGNTPVLLFINTVDRVADCRAELARLLEQLPTISVLATSRVPFRVSGEHEYPLDALPLPSMDMPLEQLKRVPAVALFLERARAVRPSFDLNPQNVADVLEILRRLEGLPYAIELMALRSRLMPVRVMCEQLDHLLDFLDGGPPDLPPRLRSMRKAIGWGYDLLTPHQQQVARTLSVFGGPFSLEGANYMLAPLWDRPSMAGLLEHLSVLVDHHVLIPMPLEGGTAGYRMSATMRAFYREKLVEHGEREEALSRELALYVHAMETNMPEFHGSRQRDLLARLDRHASNFHDALFSARDDQARSDAALRLAAMMAPYWILRGQVRDGVSLIETFLERATGVTSEHLANAWQQLGSLYVEMNELEKAREAHTHAMKLYDEAGSREHVVDMWGHLGAVTMKLGDHETARSLLDQAIEIRRASGDEGRLAALLADRGSLAMYDGDPEAAAKLYAEAYSRHMEIADLRAAVCDCVNLLMIPVGYSVTMPFEEWYQVGIRFASDISDQQSLAQLRLTNGILLMRQEISREALEEIRRALPVILESESRRLLLDSLPLVAEACVRLDDDRMAAQVLGAGARTGGGSSRFAWYRGRQHVQELERGVRHRLGKAEYSRYTTLGAHFTIEQTVQAVLELIDAAFHVAAPRTEHRPEPQPGSVIQLTRRESQVLGLVAQGLSDKDIAKQLGISPRTAMTHLSNIMAKMKVHSRSAAAEQGIRLGLIDAPRGA